jgi:competence protein ComGC
MYLIAKTIPAIAIAALLTACVSSQTNPQVGVDTAAKDDVIRMGANMYQVLRKGEIASLSELKRSATIAAAAICIPLNKNVNIRSEDVSFSGGFFGPTKSVLTTFTCD